MRCPEQTLTTPLSTSPRPPSQPIWPASSPTSASTSRRPSILPPANGRVSNFSASATSSSPSTGPRGAGLGIWPPPTPSFSLRTRTPGSNRRYEGPPSLPPPLSQFSPAGSLGGLVLGTPPCSLCLFLRPPSRPPSFPPPPTGIRPGHVAARLCPSPGSGSTHPSRQNQTRPQEVGRPRGEGGREERPRARSSEALCPRPRRVADRARFPTAIPRPQRARPPPSRPP